MMKTSDLGSLNYFGHLMTLCLRRLFCSIHNQNLAPWKSFSQRPKPELPSVVFSGLVNNHKCAIGIQNRQWRPSNQSWHHSSRVAPPWRKGRLLEVYTLWHCSHHEKTSEGGSQKFWHCNHASELAAVATFTNTKMKHTLWQKNGSMVDQINWFAPVAVTIQMRISTQIWHLYTH